MTTPGLKTLSHDLHAFADEAADHLRDAAFKTGSDATDAVEKSVKVITRAADRLRDEADIAAANVRERVAADLRDHPAAAGILISVVTSTLIALAATLALTRFSAS